MEVMVVLMIIGVLAAIAVPAALAQRRKSAEDLLTSDLLRASMSVDNALTGWHGAPPDLMQITTENTSDWVMRENSQVVTSGKLQAGDQMTGTVWVDGTFCLQATNSAASGSYIYRSDTKDTAKGTCPTGTTGLSGVDPAVVTTVQLPTAVTNLAAVSNSNNTVTITWDYQYSATGYVVQVGSAASINVAQPTGTPTKVSTTASAVPAGTAPVTVRAINANGSGPGQSQSVIVAGATLQSEADARAAGDTALQNQINSMNSDTGWISISVFATGYSSHPSYPLQVRKKNGIVYSRGLLQSTNGFAIGTNYPALFALPAGFAPTTNLYPTATGVMPGTGSGTWAIRSDGWVDLRTMTQNGVAYSLDATWPID